MKHIIVESCMDCPIVEWMEGRPYCTHDSWDGLPRVLEDGDSTRADCPLDDIGPAQALGIAIDQARPPERNKRAGERRK